MGRGLRAEKVREWTERLKRFEASSLTVAQFCKSERGSKQSYYHWKRKLRDGTAASSSGRSFQSVRVSAASTSPGQPTTIQLGRGIRIELGHDLPVAELVVTRVLDVVIDADRTQAPTRSKAK
jgi:hypothetical protein